MPKVIPLKAIAFLVPSLATMTPPGNEKYGKDQEYQDHEEADGSPAKVVVVPNEREQGSRSEKIRPLAT